MPDTRDCVANDINACGHEGAPDDASRRMRESGCFTIEGKRLLQRKDNLIAMLGHELRDPLAAISAAMRVLMAHRAAFTSDQAQRALKVLDRQVTQMASVVDDLLDATRVRHGKLEIERAPLDLRAVIAGAVDAVRPLIDKRRQELSVTVPSEPLPLHADAARLAQVVANLLGNSSKYTQERGKIALSLERGSGEAIITVRDWGAGISADFLPRIFDLFTQDDRSFAHAQGGLGVGLALVRQIVELHGGTVHASSPGPGMGSRFVVYLPLRDDPSAP